MRDAELVLVARQRAVSVQQGCGVWTLLGQRPHSHLKCFFLNISSMDEAGVPSNMPTPPRSFRQVGASLPDSLSPNKALHLCRTVLRPSIKHYL